MAFTASVFWAEWQVAAVRSERRIQALSIEKEAQWRSLASAS